MSHGISLSQTDPDLKLESYDYELPAELIAERPIAGRHHSKLLVYDEAQDQVIHTQFSELAQFLAPETTLVMNQSRVFPCRLLGHKQTGGKVEVFLLRFEATAGNYPALIKSGARKHVGDRLTFRAGLEATIESAQGDGTFLLSFNQEITLKLLEEIALVPIPPYIRAGLSDERDLVDYQTVYAKHLGSVAAPTAGLHFTPEVLASVRAKGVQTAFVTLHVGLGTFAPIKSEIITDHQMHGEEYLIEAQDLAQIKRAQKVIAVGTTSLRALESAWQSDYQASEFKSTNIFLYPGLDVNSVDGLLTNFHLPKSTLLMLVSALIGREKVLALYREAVARQYRFFSYGDAMLILRKNRKSS